MKVIFSNGLDNVELTAIDDADALEIIAQKGAMFKEALKSLATAVPIEVVTAQPIATTAAPIVTSVERPQEPRRQTSTERTLCPKCGRNGVATIVAQNTTNPDNQGKRFETCQLCKNYWHGLDGWISSARR